MTEMESEQEKSVDAKKTEKKKGERKSWEEKDDVVVGEYSILLQPEGPRR